MSESTRRRLKELEQIDARDRTNGTPQSKRLRQIPESTGRLLAILVATTRKSPVLEIGTSGGYSTVWLALGCRVTSMKITTFEIDPGKARIARETFRLAGVEDVVDLKEGDARDHLRDYQGIGFCFLDAEKDIYSECYDLLVPRLAPGGVLAADNVVSHQDILQDWVDRVLRDPRMDAVTIPIGQGLLLARKI